MNKVQQEIDQAFGLISGISVSGAAVDLMFAAKQCLRRANELAAGYQDENAQEHEEKKSAGEQGKKK